MSKSYEVINPATGLTVGQTISEDDLDKKHPGLGGAERLLGLGVIREAGKRGAAEGGAPVERVIGGPKGAPSDTEAKASGGATGIEDTKRERGMRGAP